ncbi:MAG: type II toxin-antitoxin system death-on-curing family toxin [Pikeienuella sp.]
MHYKVTLAEALEAHDQILAASGGRDGISNQANLESALGRPFHGYHETLAEKAAALLHGIAKSHGFADGNKR